MNTDNNNYYHLLLFNMYYYKAAAGATKHYETVVTSHMLQWPIIVSSTNKKNTEAAGYTNILTNLAAQTLQYTTKLRAFKNANLPMQFLGRNHWPLRTTRGS